MTKRELDNYSVEMRETDVIETTLTRGVEEIYPDTDVLEARLRAGDKLRVYCGFDPTAPSLHVGHLIQIQKLGDFQKAGCKVIFLIGDFTAMIGDPTDKTATRTILSREKVMENLATYKQQAGKILDFDHPSNPVEVKFNSEWIDKLRMEDILDLFSRSTVQQLLAHKTYQDRVKEGRALSFVEIVYPFLQGYDSVAMNIDVEVGGKDQTFNMLWGRGMVKDYLGKEKHVVVGKLLTDTSGEKMGKTTGAKPIVFLDSASSIFQQVMLWPDESIMSGFELCTRVPMETIKGYEQRIHDGESPLIVKKLLAAEVTRIMKGEEEAKASLKSYEAIVENRSEGGENIAQVEYVIPQGVAEAALIDIIVEAGLSSSKTQARTLVEQGGLRVNGDKEEDITTTFGSGEITLQKGKKMTGARRVIIAKK